MATIRRTTPDDIQAIYRFNQRLQQHLTDSNPDTWTRNPTTPQYMESVTHETTNPDIYTLIAEQDGKLVGYMSSRIQDRGEPDPRKIGIIMNAYVEPEHRHRGIATALLTKILNHFTKHQVEQITLRYINGNKEAEQYWTNLGFKPIITVANTTPAKLRQKLTQK